METKTEGQLAYEADCKARPFYHDGTPRKAWGELYEVCRWSWERDYSCVRRIPVAAA